MGDVVALKASAWTARLLKNKGGAYLANLNNAILILTHSDEWRNVIAFDAFGGRVVKMNMPPQIDGTEPEVTELGDWTRADSSRAAMWISSEYNCSMPTHIVEEAVQVVAEQWVIHPVRDYLNASKWDRKPRIDTCLIRHAGAKDTPYVRAVTKNFFISAVARIFQPGCKVDTMLILEGEPGLKKSTFFRLLAGDLWFFDSAFDVGSKDSYQVLRRKWILEWPELDNLARSTLSTVKAFMTSPVDTYRPSYAKQAIDVPRQCVFTGTVNPDGAGYLNDPTGARRFQPVTVSQRIDLKAVKEERDQLWAEATLRFRANEKWHLHDAKLLDAATREAESRRILDPWEADVRTWLRLNGDAAKGVTTEALLDEAVKMPKDRRTRADQMRMARVLRVVGWSTMKRTTKGGRRYFPKELST